MDFLDNIFTVLLVIIAAVLAVASIPIAVPIVIVVLVVRWIWKRTHNGELPGKPDPKTLPPNAGPSTVPVASRDYKHLDANAGTTPQEVIGLMRKYEQDSVVGMHASSVIRLLESAELKHKSLLATIEAEFPKGSISYDKFASPVEVALNGILQNAISLANRVQSFDSAEYLRMERLYKAGAIERGSTQMRRWSLIQTSKAEMDDMMGASDGLLLELDRLGSALAKLRNASTEEETERIAQEVRQLTEDTQYYA